MDNLRRINLETQTPAEKAIGIAIKEVEMMGADKSLTEIVMMLSRVKEILSDYVDKRDMARYFDELSDKQRNLDKSAEIKHTPNDMSCRCDKCMEDFEIANSLRISYS